jgi:hypothetical protein
LSNIKLAAKASRNYSQMEAKLAEQQNMEAAKETYSKFLFWFKWGAIASALLTAITIYFITN